MKKYKLGFLLSHPVQYNSPLFVELAANPQIDLEVLHCSREGLEETFDPGFSKKIAWDIPLLEGYKSEFLKNYSTKPSISNGFFGLINLGIVKKLACRPYDALIIHSWHYATHLLAIVTAVLFFTPVLVRSEWPLVQEKTKPKWKRFLKRIFLRTLLRNAKFLAIGKENRALYESYGVPQKQIYECPYAVDNKRFFAEHEKLLPRRESLRQELGVSKEDVVILFVGKLIDKKRPFDLLKAFEGCAASGVHLLFVGEGALRSDLEAYVTSQKLQNVHFVGFKNQTELAPYYTLSDIFVLPSSFGETWGLVVNEAMCFGLPIIVSDVVGCGSDLVRHGENGFVFKCADLNSLRDYLKSLIFSRELREKFSDSSKKIISNYSFAKDIDAILEALL